MLGLLKEFPAVKMVLMHCKGDPKTMQINPDYPLGVVSEVKETLHAKVRQFVEGGIEKSRLWIDPGIGFGKTVNHNLDLLRHLDILSEVAGRIVIGTSRKSFLGSLIKQADSDPAKREPGTLASHLWALQKGASVFRVHDVEAMKNALITWEAVQNGCF
jgi:dihydropteroate synthase